MKAVPMLRTLMSSGRRMIHAGTITPFRQGDQPSA
jgi:hypothetical protein